VPNSAPRVCGACSNPTLAHSSRASPTFDIARFALTTTALRTNLGYRLCVPRSRLPALEVGSFSARHPILYPVGDSMARDIRGRAFQRLAAIAATSPSTSFDKSDLDALCRAVPNRQVPAPAVNGHSNASLPTPEVGRVPMVGNPRSVPAIAISMPCSRSVG
jgi:hypothetical protein